MASVGAIVALALIVLGTVFWRMRRQVHALQQAMYVSAGDGSLESGSHDQVSSNSMNLTVAIQRTQDHTGNTTTDTDLAATAAVYGEVEATGIRTNM